MEVPSFCKKPYQTWQIAVKTFKKIKMHHQDNTKRVKYYYIAFLINTHISLPAPSPYPAFEDKGEM